jgi:hypothetical protein
MHGECDTPCSLIIFKKEYEHCRFLPVPIQHTAVKSRFPLDRRVKHDYSNFGKIVFIPV